MWVVVCKFVDHSECICATRCVVVCNEVSGYVPSLSMTFDRSLQQVDAKKSGNPADFMSLKQ